MSGSTLSKQFGRKSCERVHYEQTVRARLARPMRRMWRVCTVQVHRYTSSKRRAMSAELHTQSPLPANSFSLALSPSTF